MPDYKLNRIREVLRQQGRTNKWLATQLDRTENTVSRWCRNGQQPDLETLYKIAHLLQVPVSSLLVADDENPFAKP